MLHKICDAENTKGIARVGYLFAFLAAGTECRCCLGFRIAFAFLLGLAVGFGYTHEPYVAVGFLAGFVFAILFNFILWLLIEEDEDG